MRKSMPWYMYPMVTCRVLNKMANRVLDNEGCRDLMDKLTMRLWSKQESYLKGVTK